MMKELPSRDKNKVFSYMMIDFVFFFFFCFPLELKPIESCALFLSERAQHQW